MNKKLFLLLFLLWPCFGIASQTSQGAGESLYFDMSGFPQWSRDLRRGEIVAFGSFPFAYFFTNFFYDGYRTATNGWDSRYAPWPFKPADAVEKTQGQQFAALGIAAGAAITIALVDHFIVRYKRNKQEHENADPAETHTIIRRPLSEVINAVEAGDEAIQDSDPMPAGEIP